MKIRGTDFVAYEVKDFAREVAFYRDTLGLNMTGCYDDEKFQWAEFDLVQTTLALYPSQKTEKRDPLPSGMVYLSVDDVAQTVDELKDKGVKVMFGPVETPVCFIAGIQDPEGNRIGLHHRKDGTVG
jgi:predicted enzyme related to lactoylglutathione lyase